MTSPRVPSVQEQYRDTSTSGSGLSLRAGGINTLYQMVLAYLIGLGRSTAPRGIGTLELRGAQLILEDSRQNVLTIPERNLNYCFSVAEWLWIFLGRNDVKTIGFYNKNIIPFSDDGVTFAGAYGPEFEKQLEHVLTTLRRDPDSRQAVMTFWRPSPKPSKDIPCTISLQFLLREERLHCVGTMRSNDAWLGLPYDIFTFTQIQAYVAGVLDVNPGEYIHNVGSLHLYESNRQQAYFVKQATTRMTPRSPLLTPLVSGDVILLNDAFEHLAEGNFLTHTFGQPWDHYLSVLRYRTTKDAGAVGGFYQQLFKEQEAARIRALAK